MELRELRRRCEVRLRDLDLPRPFDAWSLADVLAAHRGRPIHLYPVASLNGPGGLWVSTPSADWILYERDTSPLHQEHIILHELSHLVCEHASAQVGDPAFLQDIFPHLRPELVRSVLRRATYAADDEREAELLASMLLERAANAMPDHPRPNPSVAGLIDRLESSLGDAIGG